MPQIQLKTSQNVDIPLKNVNIHSDIINQVAQFTLTKTYENTSTNPIEVFYTFPTPANASVFSFSAKIGDKTIQTVLKEKETAR